MVAGKVRAAMGLHKSSPSTKPKQPKPTSQQLSSSPGPTNPSPAGGGVFSRSLGVYFPKSSAQVQPRPPDVSDLLRLVDDLRDREHRLKTELLEFKLLKESVAIVPVLEKQLDDARSTIRTLETENQRLRSVLEEERRAAEEKFKALEAEIQETAAASVSNSQRFLGLTEASSKPCLVRNYSNKKGGGVSGSISNYCKALSMEEKRENIINEAEARPRHSRSDSEELVPVDSASLTLTHHHIIVKSRVPRVPKPPPPKRSVSSSPSPSSSSSSDFTDDQGVTVTVMATAPPAAPPPPPPPPPRFNLTKKAPAAAPPPPPPLPPMKKGARSPAAKVRRIPEVVEFYHSLMRRDSRRDAGTEVVSSTANARDMIGEIENRSAHLLAIKTDVETQGDFIRFLIKEVEEAAFSDIEDVVPFVKWLDDELSYLVDERAVLKHFDWPEQKADALREAAFGYCDLKKLESEASSFRDDARQPCGPALKKMQALFEKLEHGVYNLSRMRESASTRYKGFRIPMGWMLETGIVSQIKLASVKLAMKYMKRVSAELEAVDGSSEEEELIVQGVRFAFRVHQFAGGFDVETMRAFQELRDKARSCHVQCQNQQQQKLLSCKSTPC